MFLRDITWTGALKNNTVRFFFSKIGTYIAYYRKMKLNH